MFGNEQKSVVLDAVKEASTQWKSAFYSGDAVGCAAQYEKNAVMQAKPFGTFTGRIEIQAFWQKPIDQDQVFLMLNI